MKRKDCVDFCSSLSAPSPHTRSRFSHMHAQYKVVLGHSISHLCLRGVPVLWKRDEWVRFKYQAFFSSSNTRTDFVWIFIAILMEYNLY